MGAITTSSTLSHIHPSRGSRCLNRIEPASSDPSPVCPLCRQPYDKHYIIKLHLDTDNPRPSSANQAEQEAKRLQGKMTNLINNGASEPAIRGLLDECQKFIHSQPRNLVRGLVSYRTLLIILSVFRLATVTQGDGISGRCEIGSVFPEAGL